MEAYIPSRTEDSYYLVCQECICGSKHSVQNCALTVVLDCIRTVSGKLNSRYSSAQPEWALIQISSSYKGAQNTVCTKRTAGKLQQWETFGEGIFEILKATTSTAVPTSSVNTRGPLICPTFCNIGLAADVPRVVQ